MIIGLRTLCVRAVLCASAFLLALSSPGWATSSWGAACNINGQWRGGGNDLFDITQNGSSYSWRMLNGNEYASGTFDGRSISVSWNGTAHGSGTATGSVDCDANGWGTAIHWSNGAYFSRPASSDDLGQVWDETEVSGWQGVWTRRGDSNVFDAVWTLNGTSGTGVLTITINGSNVTVFRDDYGRGTCNYTGVLRGNTIEGTYGCTWARGPYAWRATIRGRGTTTGPGPGPAPDALGHVWRESEYGWTGTWTRRGNTNVFDAVWTLGGSREEAVLTISINGSSVSIHRDSGAKGTCSYTGTLSGRNVQGSYGCTWASGPYPWSATISD